MVAVNAEYVEPDFVLSSGDEVAIIPPVSGGDWFQVTTDPLSPEAVTAEVKGDLYGAVLTFVGTVRQESEGAKVLYLDYEAYPEMAEKKLKQVAAEIRQRWGVGQVAIAHRLGRVGVGEAALVVAVATPHRNEAFAACQYAIDRLKEIVPVWKKEVRQDGASWVESHPSEGA
jgi:molybdopterin synthase catalytic subunit